MVKVTLVLLRPRRFETFVQRCRTTSNLLTYLPINRAEENSVRFAAVRCAEVAVTGGDNQRDEYRCTPPGMCAPARVCIGEILMYSRPVNDAFSSACWNMTAERSDVFADSLVTTTTTTTTTTVRSSRPKSERLRPASL